MTTARRPIHRSGAAACVFVLAERGGRGVDKSRKVAGGGEDIDVLADRPRAAAATGVVAGHARRVVIDRPEPVAAVAAASLGSHSRLKIS